MNTPIGCNKGTGNKDALIVASRILTVLEKGLARHKKYTDPTTRYTIFIDKLMTIIDLVTTMLCDTVEDGETRNIIEERVEVILKDIGIELSSISDMIQTKSIEINKDVVEPPRVWNNVPPLISKDTLMMFPYPGVTTDKRIYDPYVPCDPTINKVKVTQNDNDSSKLDIEQFSHLQQHPITEYQHKIFKTTTQPHCNADIIEALKTKFRTEDKFNFN